MAPKASGRVVAGWVRLGILSAGTALGIGCSGGITPGSGSQTPPTSVVVSGPVDTRLGATSQFTATVSAGATPSLNWQVNGVPGGTASSGTISSSGLYSAPATLPTPANVIISAVSTLDQTAAGSLTESLWNPVPQVTSVTATLNAAQATVALDAIGSSFVPGAQLEVTGTPVATTVVSPTELRATVPVPVGVTSLIVNAINPNPGAATSPTLTVNIQGNVTTVAVSVTGPANTRLGATSQYAATVTGTTNPAVTWQVNGVTGGSAATGTISATGLYTAPAALPNPGTVTIAAISQADATASGSTSDAIWNPLPVLTSATANQPSGSTSVALDARGSGFVSGSQLQVGGVAVATTFVSSGELTASIPAKSGTTSLALSVLNPNPGSAVSSSLTVNIQSAAVLVTVTGPASTRLGSTSQFSAAVTGSANSAVNWQVNGLTGGTAATGTISASGLYTAPAALPTPNPVTISAVSQADSTASASTSEAIWNPIPVLNAATATPSSSGSSVAIDATGSSFVSGAQLQIAGTSVPTTFVSSTELQATVTPAAGATSLVVDVLNPDPGSAASASLVVQLQSSPAPLAAAARLVDQASFGATLADIQHVQAVGLNGYLNEQFAAAPSPFADIPSPEPSTCPFVPQNCAQSEWWQDALTGQDQLRQRVAFALSEIFVISTGMDIGDEVPPYQRMLLRDAFGNFSTLMKDVTLSPAMGDYLNMNNSLKPGNGEIANENFARELMQLFTMGLYQLNQDGTQVLDANGQPIPSYSQAQVQAFARVYTGWTYANSTGGSPTAFPNTVPNYDSPMAPVQSAHDVGSKTLLDGTVLPPNQTAEQDLDDALANIFANSNVPPFVCKQLIQHLVTSNPTPAYVARIAAVFTDNGNGVRGDLQAVVRAILMDPEARAGDTDPTFDGGHLREGLLYLVEVMRALGYTNTDPNNYYYQLWAYGALLDEQPYASPSVFNFYPPSYVIPGTTLHAPEFAIENTATATQRLSLANTLVFNDLPGFQSDFATTGPLGQLAGNPDALVDALNTLFMHGQMPAAMHTAIVNQISTLADHSQRTRVATYLVITSSLYKIMH